jgi:ABC-type uncharacterized transport system involved in gliding motility auxiliary subunit
MKSLIDFLSPLGLVVMAGAAVAERYGAKLPGGMRTFVVAGLVLMLAHLLLRWDEVAKRLGGRQVRYGGNTALLVVVVLAILAAVNYLASRRSIKKDFTKGQRYSLSEQSKKIVSGLSEDVRVLYFQRKADMPPRGAGELEQYEALSSHVKVEYVDPLVEPSRAREYDVRPPYPVIVLQRGEKRARAASTGEQDLTNGFLKVTRAGKKTVCFAEGAGERDIDDSSEGGFSSARAVLARNLYETRKLPLARETAIPEDCSVVAVAGPQKDILPNVVEALRAFVKRGGKLLVLDDPEFKEGRPALTSFLKEFNIEVGQDVVVDLTGRANRLGATTAVAATAQEYPYHEITRGFRTATGFPESRSVKPGTATVEGVVAQILVQTTEAAWAETDLTSQQPEPGPNELKGPVPVAAVATLKVADPSPSPSPAASPAVSASPGASPALALPSPSPSPDEEAAPPPRREGRVAVFGDSDFASNSFLRFYGNQDLFLNTVAWLAEDADLISIRPKDPDDQRLELTPEKQWIVYLLALAGLPGLFIVLGIRAWWTRR